MDLTNRDARLRDIARRGKDTLEVHRTLESSHTQERPIRYDIEVNHGDPTTTMPTGNPYALDTFETTKTGQGVGIYIANPTIPSGSYVTFDNSTIQYELHPRRHILVEFRQKFTLHIPRLSWGGSLQPTLVVYSLPNYESTLTDYGYFNKVKKTGNPTNPNSADWLNVGNMYVIFGSSNWNSTNRILIQPMLGAKTLKIGLAFYPGENGSSTLTLWRVLGYDQITVYEATFHSSDYNDMCVECLTHLSIAIPTGTQDSSYLETDFQQSDNIENDTLMLTFLTDSDGGSRTDVLFYLDYS